MRNAVLIGADPELFIRNTSSGAFISADDIHSGPKIPGTKWEPYKVPFGAVQIDGTALEFNIDPCSTSDQFIHNINNVMKTIRNMVPSYTVCTEPVAYFDADYFNYEIPSHAQELGCNPDYNAWTESVNPPPDPAGLPFRTASGHIHIGWTEDQDIEDRDHFLTCCKFVRQLDYYLGMYSLIWDPDGTRRKLYGKAGSFRPKSYGLEYRVLSNRWLESESLVRWVFNTTQIAMADGFCGVWAEDKFDNTAKIIIDENDINWPEHYPECDLQLEPIQKVR